MNAWLQDVRYGVRVLLGKPGFTIAAVIMLALGIGTTVAIFSVVNRVLLHPLPYKDPERLTMLWANNVQQNRPQINVSLPEFTDWKAQNQSFEDMSAYIFNLYNITGRGEPEQVRGIVTSGNLFQMLGSRTLLGRTYTADEDQERLVVLSYGLWQQKYGGDATIINQTIMLNDQAHTLIGVMPKEFEFPPIIDRVGGAVDLWVNFAPVAGETNSPLASRGFRGLRVVGRLKPGVTVQQARDDMAGVARSLEQQFGKTNAGVGVTVTSLNEQVVKDVRPALWMLLGAVAFVFLIACANVTNLQLARMASREKEIAVRIALGAGLKRVARQLLIENLILALVSGALGFLLAIWAIKTLVSINPGNIPRLATLGIDAEMIGFAVFVSILTAMICGLSPLPLALKVNLSESLKEGTRGSSGGARAAIARNVLVIAEVSLALVLMIGAVLLTKSLNRLLEAGPGFSPENILTLQTNLSQARYPEPRKQAAFYTQALDRLKALPGVAFAGISNSLPPSISQRKTAFSIEGQTESGAGQSPTVQFIPISADYFSALKVPLVKGRFFSESDNETAPPVAIISERMARLHFGNEDPLGKRVKIGAADSRNPWQTIVGVAGDVKYVGLDTEADIALYVPYQQAPLPGMYLVVHTNSDPLNMISAVRGALFSVDKDQPITTIKTMEQTLLDSVSQRRLNSLLLVLFAGTAVILAIAGIYGVVAYSVSQRTRDIGIRMAVGAQPNDVLKMVIGQGLKLTLVGVGIGLVLAFVLTRALSSLLFGVSATDPFAFVATALLLTGVAVAASFFPARRATRIDPIIALRYE